MVILIIWIVIIVGTLIVVAVSYHVYNIYRTVEVLEDFDNGGAYQLEEEGDESSFVFENNYTPDIEEELFVLTSSSEDIQVSIVDPATGEILKSRPLEIESYLSSSASNASGANDAVQYNSDTQEIYYSTIGFSEYGGVTCLNADGTCFNRIYKVGFDESEPTVILEFETGPGRWLLNAEEDSIIVGLVEDEEHKIKKFTTNGDLIFEYSIGPVASTYWGGGSFVLSQDHRYVYQAVEGRSEDVKNEEILSIRTIDVETGEMTVKEIYRGSRLHFDTDISPNNDYFSFYTYYGLYIYQFSTDSFLQVPVQGTIGNYNLTWSGDSSKLLYMPQVVSTGRGVSKELRIYDLATGDTIDLDEGELGNKYVFAWAPSDKYIVYNNINRGLSIINFETEEIITLDELKNYGAGTVARFY